jgi:CRP-like cAMP-binding protein
VRLTKQDLLLSDVDKRVPLRDIIGFDDLHDESLAAIAALATRREYPAGTTLVHPGERRVNMQLLVEGDLQLRRMGRVWSHPADRRVLDLFWLARDSMPLEVKTQGGAAVLEIPLAGLDEILEEHFGVWLASARTLAAWVLGVRPTSDSERLARAGNADLLSERIAALQDALPFARGFVDALMQLDAEASAVSYAAGSTLWRPGDPSDHLLVPVSGELRGVASDEPCGVGGLELLANRPRATPIEVTQPLVALRIGREAIFDLVEDHHELARDLLAMVASTVVQLVDAVVPS